ncbi:Arc family DNA-binding protein [Rhizobium leguminosarum bv. viciae]|uniref:Arc family DNA-binding protein n=1 Tax=Rhizobium leguminosarum TaxID=384 RepID=UPI0014428556|nr:Arc family DNA-binding protein [Rhizobium leguminosarum]NKK92392.1 Arc family DNA-binding protein [Rhizobium leguminosarum bv. viciae]
MARGDFPSTKQDQFNLRLPDGMREKIAEEASKSGRSMNAEIVARIDDALQGNDEVEDLWRQIYQKDARIKQLEAQGDATERLLRETLADYKAIATKQEILLQAVCYRILQFKDLVPQDAFSLAEKLIESISPGESAWPADDPEVARARYFAAIRSTVSSPADKEVKSSEPHIERVRERAKQRRQAERAASKKDSAA